MTEYINKTKEDTKKKQETIFLKYINENTGKSETPKNKPKDFKTVELISKSFNKKHGIFKAYDDGENSCMYWGEIGDEF